MNTVHQALADHSPRQIFHSWLDRFVKNLSMRRFTG